ncbi:MAG: hypothetical protein KF709_11715 [Gemmatimonadaceae bacterium]|nr:hypothetical protein [Gemmatimonadaceae bacterium]
MNLKTAGFVLGLLAGTVMGFGWWNSEQAEHQRALYDRRPMRRLAALGWLSGQPSAESVMMLREYVGWEQNPVLRRRARQLLTRFENALAS